MGRGAGPGVSSPSPGNKEGALGRGGGRRRLGPCWFEREGGSQTHTESRAPLGLLVSEACH